MSLEELRADIARNQKAALALGAAGIPQALIDYVNGTVWPWQEALLDEVDELANDMADLVDDADDILQAETASKIALAITLGADLVGELKKRMDAQPQPGDDLTKSKMAAFARSFKEATEILAEVTVGDFDEEDEDEDEDETGEDDDTETEDK